MQAVLATHSCDEGPNEVRAERAVAVAVSVVGAASHSICCYGQHIDLMVRSQHSSDEGGCHDAGEGDVA